MLETPEVVETTTDQLERGDVLVSVGGVPLMYLFRVLRLNRHKGLVHGWAELHHTAKTEEPFGFRLPAAYQYLQLPEVTIDQTPATVLRHRDVVWVPGTDLQPGDELVAYRWFRAPEVSTTCNGRPMPVTVTRHTDNQWLDEVGHRILGDGNAALTLWAVKKHVREYANADMARRLRAYLEAVCR